MLKALTFFTSRNSIRSFRQGIVNPGNIFGMEKREDVPTENGTLGQCKRPLEESDSALNETKKLCPDTEEKKVSRKKRKVALVLGYNGKNYHGMQKNSGFKTVESELLEAMHKAGFIRENDVQDTFYIKFQRAARTDKGVSAVAQVVSLTLADGYSVAEINKQLPDDIKVFGIRRATKGFDCKQNCTARTYSYTLPTYIFSDIPLEKCPDKNYRISKEDLGKVSGLLNTCVGAHNFHNFTSKKLFHDPSAKRYIHSFECGEPFLYKDFEFITCTVKGQSFMLHQIRKMIGTVIAASRGSLPEDIIQTAMKNDKVCLPKAPGLGLILEKVHYDRYDKKFGDDGVHMNLSWDDIRDELDRFRKEKILLPLLDEEIDTQNILTWYNKMMNEEELKKEGKDQDPDEDEKEEAECQSTKAI